MHSFSHIKNRYQELGWKGFILQLKNYLKLRYKMRAGYFIHPTAIVDKRNLVVLDTYAEIQEHVIIKTFKNQVTIGKYSLINPFTVIYGGSGVHIGNNVMIAPHVMIASGNHNYRQLEKPMRFGEDFSDGPIVIGDGVWIGANVTITDHITIGHNAVVSANSVVTKNVMPFDIVAGVPAKVIANRIEGALKRKLSDEEKSAYAEEYRKGYLKMDLP